MKTSYPEMEAYPHCCAGQPVFRVNIMEKDLQKEEAGSIDRSSAAGTVYAALAAPAAP
jgi:hypothetical protein